MQIFISACRNQLQALSIYVVPKPTRTYDAWQNEVNPCAKTQIIFASKCYTCQNFNLNLNYAKFCINSIHKSFFMFKLSNCHIEQSRK